MGLGAMGRVELIENEQRREVGVEESESRELIKNLFLKIST